MTLFEKIKEYLESKDKDFDTGLKLYTLASHQRSIMLYLQRKRDAVKLEYELNKLCKLIPDRLRKISLPEEKEPIQPLVDKIKDTENDPVKEVNSTDTKLNGDEHKIIEFKKINPEELPEEMRPLYHEISEKHKEMRSVHEKMKLAKTDEERAEFRNTLVNLDDAVKAGWDVIDEYFLLQQQGKKEAIVDETKSPQEAINELGKSINAARSYISRGINEYKKAPEEKRPDLKMKINKRIDFLIENKVPVAKETKGSLLELEIIAKNSKLLVE